MGKRRQKREESVQDEGTATIEAPSAPKSPNSPKTRGSHRNKSNNARTTQPDQKAPEQHAKEVMKICAWHDEAKTMPITQLSENSITVLEPKTRKIVEKCPCKDENCNMLVAVGEFFKHANNVKPHCVHCGSVPNKGYFMSLRGLQIHLSRCQQNKSKLAAEKSRREIVTRSVSQKDGSSDSVTDSNSSEEQQEDGSSDSVTDSNSSEEQQEEDLEGLSSVQEGVASLECN